MNSLVALPIAGAMPVSAMASSDVDPIFALIEEYKLAAKAVAAAASEVSRREELVIHEGLGPYPAVCVVDRQLLKPVPTLVYAHSGIDRMLPPDRFSRANAEARASLDAQIERHEAILGDSEAVLYAVQDAETEALDTLVWTTPTTIAGVLALLELLPELLRARVVDHDQADAIIISAIDALDDIHPNARLVGVV